MPCAVLEQTQIRLDPNAKRRIRKFVEKFEKKTGARIGFSAAMRLLLDQSLDREGIR